MLVTQGRLDPSVTYAIVVLTDGRSTNTFQTGVASMEAQQSFIRVIAVGIGQTVYLDELNRIRSDASSLVQYSTFINLVQERHFLENHLCEGIHKHSRNISVLVLVNTCILLYFLKFSCGF